MVRTMLTTIDNPFSPFDDFEAWYQYDITSGYYTTQYLARILITSDELSDADQELDMQRAIDEIIAENVTGMFKKVTKEFPDAA